jgi:hypothetical protein
VTADDETAVKTEIFGTPVSIATKAAPTMHYVSSRRVSTSLGRGLVCTVFGL